MAFSFGSQGATPTSAQGSLPQSQGTTPASRALNTAQSVPLPQTMPLVPPPQQNPPLKSHSIQHPDGTVVTQTFQKPEAGVLAKAAPKATQPTQSAQPTQPSTQKASIKIMNGVHHVSFRDTDGSMKFINAKGEISQ